MPYDKNELRWRPYLRRVGPKAMLSRIDVAWDHMLRSLVEDYLGESDPLVFTSTMRWSEDTEQVHVHKVDVLSALIKEELDPNDVPNIAAQATLNGQGWEEEMTIRVHKVNADNKTCFCVLYQAYDRNVVIVRKEDQDWWATRANVAWDLFGS